MTDTTIIIPTYNESENISELVKRIHASCNGVKILVIDDSPDNKTFDAANECGCVAVHRITERGLSSAVILGMKLADTDKLIVMDADLQHPPEVLPDMIKALDNNNMVVASRWIKGGGVSGWDKKRVLISKVANMLAFALAPNVKDRTSGFFGVRRGSLNLGYLNPVGWKIGLEIMARCHMKSIQEIPYIFVSRTKGKSKYNTKQTWLYLGHLAKLYLR